MKQALLEIHKDELAFSAGHFTIFSATKREHLHGHNYNVGVAFDLHIGDNGLAFDYRLYKQKLQALCDQLNTHFLLPGNSPYLTIEDGGDCWFAIFDQQRIPFLKEDVIILPLSNITIEELAHWFLQHITQDKAELAQYGIERITVKVFNGPGQSGGATYHHPLLFTGHISPKGIGLAN